MKRALMYASVASMIQQFNMDNINLLISLGYEVDVACNMVQGSSFSDDAAERMKQDLAAMGVGVYHVPVPRKITSIRDCIKSVVITRRLMKERSYSLVHVHSPIGGAVCRVAHRLTKGYRKRKMIYTAHGFHFYRGASAISWLLFYPIEKLCSRFTDVLITINKEDHEIARSKMNAGRVEYIPGVGIDTELYKQPMVNEAMFRSTLGIPEKAFLLTSVGELNNNKNHSAVVRALAQVGNPNIHYAIVGQGGLREHLQELAESLGVGDKVHLLGYRTDVAKIYAVSDACVFPSVREGLGLAALEGMASGIPLICAENRGTRSYAIDGVNAFVCRYDSVREFADAINRLVLMDEDKRKSMGQSAHQTAMAFDIRLVSSMMEQIYQNNASNVDV